MTSKILIVEDNKDLNNLLYFLITSGGYEVRQCFDGEQGMDIIKKFKPNIVVLDMVLPKVEGREILSFLQTCSVRPQVIVFSSSGWKEVRADNVHYCPKSKFSPENIKEFIDIIVKK